MLSPNLEHVISRAIASHAETQYTAVPGKIVTYDPDTQLAQVQIQINQPYDTPDGTLETDFPIVTDVPVMFPGSGKFRITFPIETGDHVLFIASTFELHNWLVTGSATESETHSFNRNDLTSGFAIPGLWPAHKSKPPKASQDEIVIHTDDKTVKIGEDAEEYVALESTLDAFLDIIAPEGVPLADPAGAIAMLHQALTAPAAGWPGRFVAKKTKAK